MVHLPRSLCASRLLALLLAMACSASGASAQAPKRLWVVQKPAGIVEYYPATFAKIRAVQVPEEVLFYPENLSVNVEGQMWFRNQNLMWFWDGSGVKELRPRFTVAGGESTGTPTRIETGQDVFLSAEGDYVYWYEQQFEKTTDGHGYERSQRAGSRVWRTSLSRADADTIALVRDDEWCPCGTGACSETCAEWDFWAPQAIVSDFFLLLSVTPGQLGPSYGGIRLYQKSSGGWPFKEPSGTFAFPLDAAGSGEILVAAEPDGGCCAWMNESSDQMVLLDHGRRSVLYDEFTRFKNQNYDVSFYVAKASLSPDHAAVAYTLDATSHGERFRLSSDGKPDAADSARVGRDVERLPIVEVLWLDGDTESPTFIAHAQLAGWLNDEELLLVKDGRLAVFDTHGVLLRESEIPAATSDAVFLR
jgi:hypothetical protein